MPIDLPKITFSIIPAKQLAGITSQRVLIPGQMLAAGSAVAGQLYQDFPSDGSEDTLFAPGSQLAGLVREFKLINKVSALDVLPVSDGAGVAGTGVITFATASATADATIFVNIVSKKRARVEVAITSGDDQTAIALAVKTAILALGNYAKLEFTVDVLLGVLTATANNLGTLANDWGISIEGDIPGVGATITAWAGGTTDPTLTSILDAIGDTRYQTILWPSVWDLTVVETLLNARFNKTNAVADGVAIQAKADTLANAKTYADQNSQSIVIPVIKKIAGTVLKGPATLESPDIIATQICAIRALRFTNNAILTQYLTTLASKDQFGGSALASLPYFNTALPGLPVADIGNDFAEEDLTELSENGLSVIGPNKAFNGTIFGEFVTTYLTDTAGNADTSFKFLNTVDTASVIREFFFVNCKTRYAQTRLTDGDLVEGRDMANESAIRAFANELYDSLADEAITQKGRAAKKDFNLNLVLSVDVRTGTVTMDMAPLQVGQFRIAIGTIQINFGG